MTRLPNRGSIIALVAAMLLAGCNKAPGGQVIATVDAKEITRRDLLGELRAMGGRSEADLNSVQASLASALVDRKLLVEEAQREKLDKNPEFLAAEQRQRDLLLATMLAQSFAARIPKPSAAAARQFMAENPQMFGGRKLLLASQINAPGKGITAQEIAPLHGQQAIVDYLKAKKIAFGQRTTTLDTMTLPKELAVKLLTLPRGEPIAVSNGDSIVFTTILNSKDAPVPADQQAALAQSAMMQQAAGKQLQDQLKQLRSTADIKYLPGFAPPAPPAGAPAGQ